MLRRIFLAGLVAVACCIGNPASAQTLPPAEAFGRLPLTSNPRLSPDGKHFAVMQSMSGRPVAVIYETVPTPGSKPAVVSAGAEMIIDDIRWAKNDRLILFVKHSYTPVFDKLRTWMRTVTVNLQGNDFAQLMRNMPTYQNNTYVADVIDVNLDDPDHILMGLYDIVVHINGDTNTLIKKENDDFKYDLIKVDVRTGRGVVYKSGDSRTTGWVSDGQGTPVVQIRQTDHPLQDHVLTQHNGSWSEIGVYEATADTGSGVLGL